MKIGRKLNYESRTTQREETPIEREGRKGRMATRKNIRANVRRQKRMTRAQHIETEKEEGKETYYRKSKLSIGRGQVIANMNAIRQGHSQENLFAFRGNNALRRANPNTSELINYAPRRAWLIPITNPSGYLRPWRRLRLAIRSEFQLREGRHQSAGDYIQWT